MKIIGKIILSILLTAFVFFGSMFTIRRIKQDNLFVTASSHNAIQYLIEAEDLLPLFNFNVTTLLGKEFIIRKQYKRAILAYNRSLKSHPNNINGLLNMGYCLLKLKRFKDAQDVFTRYLTIYPESSKGWNNLGIALASVGKFKKAEQCYLYAIQLSPDYLQPKQNLRNLYIHTKQYWKLYAKNKTFK